MGWLVQPLARSIVSRHLLLLVIPWKSDIARKSTIYYWWSSNKAGIFRRFGIAGHPGLLFVHTFFLSPWLKPRRSVSGWRPWRWQDRHCGGAGATGGYQGCPRGIEGQGHDLTGEKWGDSLNAVGALETITKKWRLNPDTWLLFWRSRLPWDLDPQFTGCLRCFPPKLGQLKGFYTVSSKCGGWVKTNHTKRGKEHLQQPTFLGTEGLDSYDSSWPLSTSLYILYILVGWSSSIAFYTMGGS